MTDTQRIAQLEAMLLAIVVEDGRAAAMSDYRSGTDFAPLRRAIGIARCALPLGAVHHATQPAEG